MMRKITFVLGLVIATVSFGEASHADPYRWCAQYAGRGSTNCYFVTLEQCRGALAGAAEFCRPNPFYTGPEVNRSTRQRRSG